MGGKRGLAVDACLTPTRVVGKAVEEYLGVKGRAD
jgi:hypothetical protein